VELLKVGQCTVSSSLCNGGATHGCVANSVGSDFKRSGTDRSETVVMRIIANIVTATFLKVTCDLSLVGKLLAKGVLDLLQMDFSFVSGAKCCELFC